MAKQKTTKEDRQGAARKFIIKQFRKIAVAISVACAASGYFFIVQPERAKLFEKSITDVVPLMQEKQLKETTLNRFRRELNEFAVLQAHNSEVLQRMLPPLSQKEEVFFTLTAVASSLNFYLSSLNIEKPVSAEEYFGSKLDVPLPISVVPVSVNLRGPVVTYDGLKTILRVLHSRYGIFNINNLEFGNDTAQTRDRRSTGELKLKIDVFFLSDET